MSARGHDFKLGLFVLGGIALLAVALFLFEGARFFQGKTVQETYIEGSVEGLKKGSMVTLRGLPVGEVTGMNLTWNVYHQVNPSYVYVEFTVRKNRPFVPPGPDFAQRVAIEVQRGLRARVKTQGLAGATVLALEYVRHPEEFPPLPISWTPRHMYIPSAPGQMEELVSDLQNVASDIKRLNLQELSGTLEQDLLAGQRVLQQLEAADLRALGANVNGLTTELQGIGRNVDGLVNQWRELSERLETFVGQPSSRTQTLPELSARTDVLLGQMSNLVNHLDTLAGNLNGSDLNEILENTRQAAAEMEQVARNLNQYPAGVLFGRPPPPAKSVEKVRR